MLEKGTEHNLRNEQKKSVPVITNETVTQQQVEERERKNKLIRMEPNNKRRFDKNFQFSFMLEMVEYFTWLSSCRLFFLFYDVHSHAIHTEIDTFIGH